jgi:hypothetical protein
VIVADTGTIVALVDADDRHHGPLRRLFESEPDAWILPWAVLPEVDSLLAEHVGARAQEIARRHRGLRLGLVDSVVMAVAERRRAAAIATLDLRHFGAVTLRGRPRLLPRDLD